MRLVCLHPHPSQATTAKHEGLSMCRMSGLTAAALLTAVAALSASVDRQQAAPTAPAGMQQRIGQVPAALRDRARVALAEPDEAKRGNLIEDLIQADPPGTLDFVLAVLEEDASPVVRAEILDELKKSTDPRIGPALERRILRDPDPKIAIGALEVLR